jgi:periplasmic protein TonB
MAEVLERSFAETLRSIPDDMDDIVFAQRNKAYGAYFMRKKYPRTMIVSIAVGLGLALAVIVGSVIAKAISGASEREDVFKMKEVELPIDPNEPPPPPPPEIPPPPKVATVRFLPPDIKPDEQVKEEELPPPVEDLANKQISTRTEEGDANATEMIVEPGDGGKEVVNEPQEEQIFTAVEIMPEFNGGQAALKKFLEKNLTYPKAATRANVSGKVYVQFVVDENGRITSPSILKSVGFGCDEEALRVIALMPPWKAGRQGGRGVKVKYTLPVNFSLQN